MAAPYTWYLRGFNGTSNYMKVPYAAILQPTAALTVEIRCKLGVAIASQGQDYPHLIANMTSAGVGSGFSLYFIKANSNIAAQIRSAGVWRVAQWDASGLDINLMHHYAATFDGQYTRLYVDGDLKATNDIGSSGNTITYDANTNFNVGAFGWDTGNPFRWWINAQLDEVRLWSAAQSQANIQANMWGEVDAGSASLNGYWKFDDTGSTADDATANANDGTYSGTTMKSLLYWPNATTAAFTAKSTTRALKVNAVITNYSAQTPNTIKGPVSVFPTPAVMNITAQTIVIKLIQKATPSVINYTVATSTLRLTQQATASVITLALPPPIVNISRIYPTQAVDNFTSQAVKNNLVIYPTQAVANFTPVTPSFVGHSVNPTATNIVFSTNGITASYVLYPTPTVAQFSSQAVKNNQIIYPSQVTIEFIIPACNTSFSTIPNPEILNFTLPTPTVVNATHPTSSTIVFQVQNPTVVNGAITILPSAAVLNLQAQGIIVTQNIKPNATQVAFSANDIKANLAFNTTAAIATFSVPAPTIIMGAITVFPDAGIANFITNSITPLQIVKPTNAVITFSIQNPELTATVYPDPAVINFTLPTPTIIEGAITVNVTPVTATFSAQTPILIQTQKPVACVANFSANNVKINILISPDAADAQFIIPTPYISFITYPTVAIATFQANAIIWTNVYTIQPTSTIANFSLPTPTLIAGGITVTPSVVTATFNAVELKANLTIYPTTATATFTIPSPIISLVITVHPTGTDIVFSVPTPVLIHNITIIATPAVIQFVIPNPFIANIYPDPVVASFSANDVKTNLGINPSSATANFSIPNPTISSKIIPNPASATFSAQTPTIVKGPVTVIPASATEIFTAHSITSSNIVYPTPTVIVYAAVTPTLVPGAVTILATATSAAFSIPNPTIILGTITVTPSAASAVYSANNVQTNVIIIPNATIIAFLAKDPAFVGNSVSPNSATLTFSAQIPTIVAGAVTITPSAASATFSAKTPFVYSALIILNFTVKIYNEINYHVETEER